MLRILGDIIKINRYIILIGLMGLMTNAGYGEEFSVTKGGSDRMGHYSYSETAGTLQLTTTDAKWVWYLGFGKPGIYTVSARVAVSASHAGATLRIGDWISQHNAPGAFVEAILTSTHPSADENPEWQTIGQLNIPQPGLRRIFACVPNQPTDHHGLFYDLRIEGPGVVLERSYAQVRAAAADIYFSPEGNYRRSSYVEMVPRPAPIPGIYGTHTVINEPQGYMGNNDGPFISLWDSYGHRPEPLVAFGGVRVFTHEGSGASISMDDFYIDPTRRRKVFSFSVPDGSGDTITTYLAAEVGQKWHLGGRLRQYGSKYEVKSGFIENFSIFNANIHQRSCAWGNVWAYGKAPGGDTKWWANNNIKAHLRGPSPPEPTQKAVAAFGANRKRQDMVEMIIGGLIPITQNDTWYNDLPATPPILPTLNVACNLVSEETILLMDNASIDSAYSSRLKKFIKDPFAKTAFSFEKVSGPDWISVNDVGRAIGTPTSSDIGLNLCVVRATLSLAGISGNFTVGIYVEDTANNAPIFLDHSALVQTVPTLDDPLLLDLSFVDPDSSDQQVCSIVAGNTGGVFGINSEHQLIKVGTPTAGHLYSLTLQVSDNGTPSKSDILHLDVQVVGGDGMGGATSEIWYIVAGESLTNLTTDLRYPDTPDVLDVVRDFEINLLSRMTGHRVRGYLYPPADGSYRFYKSFTSAVGEFRLSTDESPDHLTLIEDNTSITLSNNQRYYFEMVCKNISNYNGGKLSLKWEGPSLPKQIIQAQYLSCFTYATPSFGSDLIALRDVLVNENYTEILRSKLGTIHLWNMLIYQKQSGPDWVSISPDGLLTGTPAAGDMGINTVVIRITAPGGHYDEIPFTIQVQPNSAPQFSNPSILLPNLDEYSEIKHALNQDVTDVNIGTRLGFGDLLSFDLVSGPAWLNVDSMGELFGSPSAADQGLNTFTVRVTDLGGLTAETQLSFTVNDVMFAPVIPAVIHRNLFENQWFEGTLANDAYDLDNDVLLFSKVSGPSWFTLLPDGSYVGQTGPTHPAITDVVIQVADGQGGNTQCTLKLQVLPNHRIAYEGFDGTAGNSIRETSGGTGWSTVWKSDSRWFFGTETLSFPGMNDVLGLKAILGRDDTTLERFFHETIVVGSDEGNTKELWISALIDLSATGGITKKESVGIKLLKDSEIGFFGKKRYQSIGFDLGGWHAVSGNLGKENGTAGKWFMVLHLKTSGSKTDLHFYAARDDESFNISDPTSFPHTAHSSVIGKVFVNGIGMYCKDNTESFIDEICVSHQYDALYSVIDHDKDGLLDVWEITHFGNITAQTAIEDPDSDEVTNQQEQYLNSDPNNPNDPAPEQTGLRAWWKLDDILGRTVTDSSGNGAHGIRQGPLWVNTGHRNGSFVFDGQDDMIRCGTLSSLEGTTDLTLAAWIKTTSTADGVILQQRGGGKFNGEYQLLLKANGTVYFMLYGNETYQYQLNTTQTVNDGEWHLIVAVRNGLNGYIYIDGNPTPAASVTGPAICDLDDTIEVFIGKDDLDHSRVFNGLIDEIRIYDRALTPSECSALYTLPASVDYLSDINWDSATTGWGGSVKKDHSINNNALKLDAIIYPKGLGTHAQSEIVYHLNGNYASFHSIVGIDDETGTRGDVIFKVYGDDILLYETSAITGSGVEVIDVNVTGVQFLKLVADKNGSNSNDHADWADAWISTSASLAPTPLSQWKNIYFTPVELSNPAISGDDADVDDDHLGNLIEYALGLDPKVHSGSLAGCAIELDGSNGWKVEFNRHASRNDIDLVLEWTDELNPVNWQPVAQSIAGGVVQALNGASLVSETGSEPTVVELNVPSTVPHGFIRWKVERR